MYAGSTAINVLTLNITIYYNKQLQKFRLLAQNANLIMVGYSSLSVR